MTDDEIQQMEMGMREMWGFVLGVSLRYPDDEQVKQSFQECDRIVRAAGLV
jgi:hypothetical protein